MIAHRPQYHAKFVFIATLVVSLASCDRRSSPTDVGLDAPERESVSVAIPVGKVVAAILARAEVVVSAVDMEQIRQELVVSGDVITGTIRGIPAGTARTFTLNGYDRFGRLVYSGSQQTDILPGQMASVAITLRRVGTSAGSVDPSWIIVAGDGTGDYTTLRAAVASAERGDAILVTAGLYDEQITIDKELAIFGTDPRLCRIVYSGAGNAITLDTNSGSTQLMRLLISSASGSGIVCMGRSSPLIRNNVLTGNAQAGILIAGDGPRARIINNVIGDNAFGVFQSSPNATLLNNIIHGNATGIKLHESTLPVDYFKYNYLWTNSKDAVRTRDYAAESVYLDADRDDPEFRNPRDGDYRLEPTSACVDQGQNSSVYTDLDGSPNDMGAYGGPFAPDTGDAP